MLDTSERKTVVKITKYLLLENLLNVQQMQTKHKVVFLLHAMHNQCCTFYAVLFSEHYLWQRDLIINMKSFLDWCSLRLVLLY